MNAINYWLALTIGNSRLRWGLFADGDLKETQAISHLKNTVQRDKLMTTILQSWELTELPIYLISVVPQQTEFWLNFPHLTQLTLRDIPLHNLYSTMGIDRAMAVFGAGETYGYPCLTIDGGTALTFTGLGKNQELIGGAILPGLRSQFGTLHDKTAALPNVKLPDSLPNRWGLDTESAIASGILHVTIAGVASFIEDWYKKFPHSAIVLAGGDGDLLLKCLTIQCPNLAENIILDAELIFWGIRKFFYRDR